MRISRMICCAAVLALVASASVLPAPAMASPGGLNAEGCHTNRKTGDYHCHRKGRASRAPAANGRMMLLDEGARGGAYRNCAAARAAGAAPVRRGEPGYGLHLDRDRDGVGCE